MSVRAAGATPSPSLGIPWPLALLLAAAGALLASRVFAHPYANPDSRAFEALTRALLAGQGLRYREPLLPWLELYAFRSPGYPLFAAPFVALGGIPLVLAAQGALVVATALAAGTLVARLATRTAGRVAFALVLVWPPAWDMAGQYLSETLFVALSAAALLAALVALEERRLAPAVWAGVLASLAALTRPVGVAVVAALALGLALRAPRLVVPALLAAALVYVPWPLRNQRVLGVPVLFTTNAGFNLADGASRAGTPALWQEMSHWQPLGELVIDARWGARYRALVTAAPAHALERSGREFVHDLVPLERGPEHWLHRALALLALVGFALWLGSAAGAMLGAAWWGQGALNSFAHVNARYRFPGEWLVAVFAVLAWVGLERRFGARTAWLVSAACVGLGGLLLVAQVLKGSR